MRIRDRCPTCLQWITILIALLITTHSVFAIEFTNNLDAAVEVCNQYNPELNRGDFEVYESRGSLWDQIKNDCEKLDKMFREREAPTLAARLKAIDDAEHAEHAKAIDAIRQGIFDPTGVPSLDQDLYFRT